MNERTQKQSSDRGLPEQPDGRNRFRSVVKSTAAPSMCDREGVRFVFSVWQICTSCF